MTIAAGESSGSATLGVPLLADTTEEEDEKLSITGTAQGFTVSPAELIIRDDDRTDPTDIVLFASPLTLQEDAGATDVHVLATLRGGIALTTDTAIDLSLGDGTVTLAGGDYTASTGTVTILAQQLIGTGTITVTPKTDAIVEPDETVAIEGTVKDSELDVSPVSITIRDINTAELSISGPASSVTEGSDATFTVTLSYAVEADVTVAWSAPLGTDSADAADLGATSGTVTFGAGSAAGATQDITITATDDDLSETSESFTMTLGAITGALSSQVSLKSGASSAQATIAESDPITVSISGPSSVDEGDATTDYTVSLSGVTPTADLTVSYATSDGTATAGTDYTAIPATTLTFTVTTKEDTFDESDETFTVSISSPSDGGGPAPSLATAKSVTTTITDDDDAVSGITLSASPNSVGEDDEATSVTITATLDGGSTRPSATVVTIGALAGTATKDTDYTATALASITIAANATSGTGSITITPTDDSVVEGDETITVSGTTTTAVGLSVSDATVTLTDDDKSTTNIPGDKDSAELSIAGPASSVSEGSNATFTVTLSAAVAKDVTVAWSAPLSADSAAGADLGATSGTVTFAGGSAAGSTETITITATDDSLSETSESFTVTLGAITSTLPASQVSLKNGASSAQGTIAESDAITVSISGPSSVDEGDATGNYTVSLSPSGVTPTSDLTVSYATADDTAEARKDYTAKSGTLTFTKTAAGSQTFTVATTADTFDEGTGETFTVSIASPLGGGPAPSLATAKSVTTTVTDDDDAVSGITLSASPNTLGEDDGKTSFTVTATLDGSSTRPSATEVTIGALAGTAVVGTGKDYTVNTALTSITIAANQASGTGSLEITPTDDVVVEGDETIVISGTATGLTVSDATITLTDDDKSTTTVPGDKDSAELSIAGPTGNISEGSDATFTVTLSAAVSKDVTVAWSAPLSADSAKGADLSATSGTVTFKANSAAGATKTITITATDDLLSETAESFTVTLGAITSTLSSQMSLKNGESSDTATISASDAITIELSGPDSVTEGETATYTVSLTPSGVTPSEDLTVDYATSDPRTGAIAGEDYTAVSGTLTFTPTNAGDQQVVVQTTDDILVEGTERFNFKISKPQGGGGPNLAVSSNATSTNINDNDTLGDPPNDRDELTDPVDIRLTVSPDSVDEGAGETDIKVTATLDGDPKSKDVTIQLVLAGTAEAGTGKDYTAPDQASMTIPAKQSSGTGTLTLTINEDNENEGDETIIVGGSYESLTIKSAVITINDDESTYLSITGPASNVSEDSDATFTVTLSKNVATDVTVAWTDVPGTAVTSDYSATPATLTFAANSGAGATKSITIPVTDDNLSETAESFAVALGTVTGPDVVHIKSTASNAVATIAESDPISVSISGPTSVSEGDATSNYTVAISGGTPTADLTVDYATADGTAVVATDYTAKSGTVIFTSDDHADKTFTVQTTEDLLFEVDETFTVSISGPSGGGATPTLGTDSVTTTILNDDPISDDPDNPALIVTPVDIWLTVAPDTVNEGAGSTSFTVTATHSGAAQSTGVTISLALAGTAEAGTGKDYTAPSQASVTIPANQTSGTGTLTLDILDDNENEGDEVIIVGGSSTGLKIASDILTIHDDDAPYLSITGPASNVSEGSDATFTVTLSKAVAAEVEVAWNAASTSDSPDPAVAEDLSTTTDTVTFAANSEAGATRTITIPVVNDTLSEAAESFTVTLGAITSTPSSQVFLKSGASSATATIAESDPITVSISGPSSVGEGDTTSNYTVSISGGTPTADLTVDYATSDGSATAGSDYTAVQATTLRFTSADHADKTFTVSTTEDILDESDETFTVSLSNQQGGGATPTLGTSSSVETTITDDDDTPSKITLSVSPTDLGEDDGQKDFTVTATLDGGSTLTTPLQSTSAS